MNADDTPLVDKDVIVYCHGITPSPQPQIQLEQYNLFSNLLCKYLQDAGKTPPLISISLHWGFPVEGSGTSTPAGDQLLSAVERRIYSEIQLVEDQTSGFEFSPFKLIYRELRRTFLLGFADLFYYVSSQGKAEVQANIFNTFLRQLPPLEKHERYSFTIVAHSAGAVIMQDLLHAMFGPAERSSAYKRGTRRNKIDLGDKPSMDTMRELADSGRVRIRCFVTLGSPIAPLVVRHQDVLETIDNAGNIKHGRLSLHDIGIRASETGNSKWLNFWDIDDVVSYPVAFLYENPSRLVEDYRVQNAGYLTHSVHAQYWYSEDVARIVAANYPNP